jgi:uncharacterized membrane protein YhaH (DUF805 family)
MQCRGFDGTFPALQEDARQNRASFWYAVVISLALIALRVFGFSAVVESIGRLV